ncbi:MAG: EAL domain-containing protein [Burkholderiales bacterium]|nr:EAL domain-containing protein [Burkholderiales bacterium]
MLMRVAAYLLALIRRISPNLAAVLIVLSGILAAIWGARLEMDERSADRQRRLLSQVSLAQIRLANDIRNTFNAADGLVHLIGMERQIGQELFDHIAAQALRSAPQIRSISLAPQERIALIYPRAGNQAALGSRYDTQSEDYVAIAQARNIKQAVLSGPLKSTQGEMHFVLRWPIFLQDGRYWGLMSISADAEQMLAASTLAGAEDIRYALIGEGGRRIGSRAGAGFDGKATLKLDLPVPGGVWQLLAAPGARAGERWLWASKYFVSLLAASILLAGLVWLVLQRQKLIEVRNALLSEQLASKEQTEGRLAAEENRFQSMFDSSPDPTWIIDGHQFATCNQAAVKILGYASKDDLRHTHPSRLSPEFQADGEASYSKAERMMRLAEERGLHRFEWIHTRLDGSNFPAEVTLSRMTLKGRQVIYCVWRDISERKAAEAKVAENQQLLHAVVENAPAQVFVFDATGKLILCNQQFEKAAGHPREDLVGRDRSTFLPAEIAREHLENDLQVLATGQTISFEENNLEPDGKHIYLTVKSPLYSASGAAWAVVGVSTDITQRKRSENESRLAATVFEHTADGIIIADSQANIVSVNRAFSEITGYSAADAIGSKPSMLKSEHQDALFYQNMWDAILEDGVWQGEIWNRRKNGELFPCWQTITAVRGIAGEIDNFVSVFSDIAAIKRSQKELEHLAHFDILTELPNRALFKDRASHAFEQARRYQHKVALLLLDLDGFKTVNDSLGHPVGDRLLQRVAARLKKCVRTDDTVARMGGDEFAVVLSNLSRGEDAIEAARKILLSTQDAYSIDDHSVRVTASIGIAVFPDDGEDINDLIRNADAAMYEAKGSGRNNYRFYQIEMTQAAQLRLDNERGLRRAIEHDEFEVWYQPQICLASGAYLGAEALLRWRDPERGLISPLEFVPLAESSGMIIPIGELVLQTVCRDVRRWMDAGLDTGRLAINVAGPQLYRSDFVGALRRSLKQYRIPPGALEIEVTETFMMENPDEIRNILNAVQNLGITTAIDDFGTGYSSLAYLKELPIDTLKIDRAFIRDLPGNASDIAIVRAILALGHSMGFNVIAEGIETPEQRDFLQAEGCKEGQGYCFAKPMPGLEFAVWLRRHQAAIAGNALAG